MWLKNVFASLLVVFLIGSVTEDAKANCDRLKQFSGKWKFTTLVTQAKGNRGIGATGYYAMDARVDRNCRLQVQIAKTGYGKKTFKPHLIQVGRTQATTDFEPWGISHIKVPIILENQRGVRLNVFFYFRLNKGKLEGHWRYVRKDAERYGMAGGLVGKKNARTQPKMRSRSSIPKDIRCLLSSCMWTGEAEGYECGNGLDMCQHESR